MKKYFILIIGLFIFISACQKKNAQSLYDKGISKANKGDYSSALANFNKAIELDESNPLFFFARAFYAYENLENYEKAIEDYTTSIDLKTDDNDAAAYSNRGHARYMLKKYKEAVTDIQKSISLDPMDPYAYRNRALIFIEINNMPMACLDLEKAIELGYVEKYDDEVLKLQEEHCNDK